MNQGFKVLVFLAFGYLIFNVPLVGDIAKFFWYLIQLELLCGLSLKQL
jgi:hypothetical protein